MTIDYDDLSAAAATWNKREESLNSVNARIHDGVPLGALDERADRYVGGIFGTFPYVKLASGATVMEVGSGTGYIMQAMARHLHKTSNDPARIIGLDIAENMLEKAKQRIKNTGPFEFLHYNSFRGFCLQRRCATARTKAVRLQNIHRDTEDIEVEGICNCAVARSQAFDGAREIRSMAERSP